MTNRQGVTRPIFRCLTAMILLMSWAVAVRPAQQAGAANTRPSTTSGADSGASAPPFSAASPPISPSVPVSQPNHLVGYALELSTSMEPARAQAAADASRDQSPTDANAPKSLTLQQAIEMSLTHNLSTLLAHERRREARGRELQAFSGVLPDVSGSIYQASITENIAALGFKPGFFPGFNNTFIGPFSNFDARLNLVQNIFNLSAIRRAQSGKTDVQISNMEEDLARQQVTSQTALAYLEALRSVRAVEAARADLDLANSLYKLAFDQHDAGIATGVDVTRAETRVAQQQYRLADANRAAEQARLQLLRVVGLPLGTSPNLADALRYVEDLPTPTDEAVQTAEQTRMEIRIAQQQVKLNDYDRRAAEAEQYPSLEFDGNYGMSGVTPGQDDLPTRTVMIRLNVPIFNGGTTRGRIEETTSRFVQAQLTLNDTRAQVEEDVRLAQQTLTAAADEVRAADQAFTLAVRQLQMARDRFQAGVADNIEVINAQTDLADARLSQVAALAQYTAARINLFYALGRISLFSL